MIERSKTVRRMETFLSLANFAVTAVVNLIPNGNGYFVGFSEFTRVDDFMLDHLYFRVVGSMNWE